MATRIDLVGFMLQVPEFPDDAGTCRGVLRAMPPAVLEPLILWAHRYHEPSAGQRGVRQTVAEAKGVAAARRATLDALEANMDDFRDRAEKQWAAARERVIAAERAVVDAAVDVEFLEIMRDGWS